MNSERMDADVRAADIWRTAQRRRAAYLATLIDEPTDGAEQVMARRLAIPTTVLASGMMVAAVWALA